MSRIIILVEGGVVQGVKSDDPFIDVAILDMDNYREDFRQQTLIEYKKLKIEYNSLEFNI
jgi:hypothetical protein